MAKPQGVWTCAFCGRSGERSKEHVLAQCFEKILPGVPATYDEYDIGIGLNAARDAYSPMAVEERRTARKKILDRVTRDVCTLCNSGWMGNLDDAAKPIIARLRGAGRESEPVRLSEDDAWTLTRWAVKTAWTNELSNAGDKQRGSLTTTQAEREALSREELPSRSRLWLAYFEGTTIDFAQAYGGRDWHSPPLECEPPRRFMVTAIHLAGPVFFLGTGEVDGYFLNLAQDQHTMVWPYALGVFPPRAATGEQLTVALTSFDHWIKRHPLPYDPAGVADVIGPHPIFRIPGGSRGRR